MADTRGEFGPLLVSEINGTSKAVPADAELLLCTPQPQDTMESEEPTREVRRIAPSLDSTPFQP